MKVTLEEFIRAYDMSLSTKEVATRLGISESTVRRRASHCWRVGIDLIKFTRIVNPECVST